MAFDIGLVRAKFMALAQSDDGVSRVYLDNPGGTQVPVHVMHRMRDYLVQHNSNKGGQFITSRQSDAVLEEAHRAMAELLNARSAEEIVFGPNMTTLTYQFSRALGRTLQAGDEIILTRMDHDANVSPWLQLAEDHGLVVKWLDFSPETYRYEMPMLEGLLSERTKVVAVNYASNAIGTINDVKTIAAQAKAAGALVFVDAVQYVPHDVTDVQALGCDVLVCSPYKFFGPHQGVLWARADLLRDLPAYRVRPAGDKLPGRWETGTQSHEGQAGTLGALEYLAWLGRTMGDPEAEPAQMPLRQRRIRAALRAAKAYEDGLSRHLIAGLQAIEGVTVHGITDPTAMVDRVPTVAFTHDRLRPAVIAKALGEANIFVWHGHYYAIEVVNRLGLMDSGGMLRVGMAHYNTTAELDRLLEVVAGL